MCFTVDTPSRTPPEREIVCVSLKKDPKLGFGEFIKAVNEWVPLFVTAIV